MRDYLTLHLDTKLSKGTACKNKVYKFKWTPETIQHYTWTQIKVTEQLVVRKYTYVNGHERLSNITLRHTLK